MFDIGWTELLIVGVVALIVVGPKDLPVMFRTLGQFTAKARAMAREFQRAMDDAADASGVKDAASDLRKMTSAKSMGLDEIDKVRNWDPLKQDAQGKGAKGNSAKAGSHVDPDDGPRSEDEEAADEIDQIAAEMEAMRQSRAKTAKTASTPPRKQRAPKAVTNPDSRPASVAKSKSPTASTAKAKTKTTATADGTTRKKPAAKTATKTTRKVTAKSATKTATSKGAKAPAKSGHAPRKAPRAPETGSDA